MSFVPHTSEDVQSMLQTIGVNQVTDLFEEIPESLLLTQPLKLPKALDELALSRLMKDRAAQDNTFLSYLGAGAYQHYIPAAVWEIVGRGEWLTCYTPYQAEASQGSLQLIYEYQTMMASLTGMEVSNASLYDGATALAEAILMAARSNGSAQKNRVLMPSSVNPLYQHTVDTIIKTQHLASQSVNFVRSSGLIDVDQLKTRDVSDVFALVIQQPNFFGGLEDVHALTDWAKSNGLLVIACVNPMSLALLCEPGSWGKEGADIVCGEGQPLGVPLASGGPYFGFLTSRMSLVRQMPGRIVGATVDEEGRKGFALTLQAREQHIRRAKAKSNICTNQGLLVTAATIYMSLMGFEGLKRVAEQSHANMNYFLSQIKKLSGVHVLFDASYFHECVLHFDKPVKTILEYMQKHNILAGLSLKPYYSEYDNALLVCTTEIKRESDIDQYIDILRGVL